MLNSGLGPARILSFTIFLDGQPVETKSGDSYAGWLEVGEKLRLPENSAEVFAPGIDSWITAGAEYWLLELSESLDKEEAKELFERIMPRLGFKITYESLYGKEEVLKR